MRTVIGRIIAILLLVIPGWMAAYGFLEVKNTIFDYMAAHGDENPTEAPRLAWGRLIKGAVLFLIGTGFIGGWIFYRDRKRNYVAPRFKARKKPPGERP
jgi:hypothetical protein